MTGMAIERHARFLPGTYYHIYNRGNNKEDLFSEDDNYLYFLSKWKKYISPYTHTLAYCLMPNHFHFLIKVKNEYEINFTNPQRLSKARQSTKLQKISRHLQHDIDINKILEDQFRNLFSSYTLAFNRQQNRTGSLFQKRFKRILINSEEYLSRIIHYIHHNPIHHNFVTDYENWKYSSYNAIISNKPSMIEREEPLNWYGGKTEFINYHKLNLTRNEFEQIKEVII